MNQFSSILTCILLSRKTKFEIRFINYLKSLIIAFLQLLLPVMKSNKFKHTMCYIQIFKQFKFPHCFLTFSCCKKFHNRCVMHNLTYLLYFIIKYISIIKRFEIMNLFNRILTFILLSRKNKSKIRFINYLRALIIAFLQLLVLAKRTNKFKRTGCYKRIFK